MGDAEAVRQTRKPANLDKYLEMKDKIVGFGVDFPIKFLENEDAKKMNHFEFGLYMLPSHIFT